MTSTDQPRRYMDESRLGISPLCCLWACQSQMQQSTGLFLLGRNVCLAGMKWPQPYSLKEQEALQVSPNCPPLQLNSNLEEQTNLCTQRVPELSEEAAGRVRWIQSKTERFQTWVLKHHQQKTTLPQQPPLGANTLSLLMSHCTKYMKKVYVGVKPRQVLASTTHTGFRL